MSFHSQHEGLLARRSLCYAPAALALPSTLYIIHGSAGLCTPRFSIFLMSAQQRKRALPTAPSDLPTPASMVAAPSARVQGDDDLRVALEHHMALMNDSISKLGSLLVAAKPSGEDDVPSKRARSATVEGTPDSGVDTAASEPEDSSGNLTQLREQLRAFAVERNWDQFHTPRNICLALVGEIGELAECFQWKGDTGAATGLPDWPADKKEHLGEELADCLLYLVRLADSMRQRAPTDVDAHVCCSALRTCIQMSLVGQSAGLTFPQRPRPRLRKMRPSIRRSWSMGRPRSTMNIDEACAPGTSLASSAYASRASASPPPPSGTQNRSPVYDCTTRASCTVGGMMQ